MQSMYITMKSNITCSGLLPCIAGDEGAAVEEGVGSWGGGRIERAVALDMPRTSASHVAT